MNATTSLHHYRGHPVVITKTTSHAGEYYTQTNETVAAMMADVASDDEKDAQDATICQRTYATEAGAKAGAAAEIEDAIGAAESYEIEEALADILADADSHTLQKLRDALASYAKENGTGITSDHANKALAAALHKAATPRTN